MFAYFFEKTGGPFKIPAFKEEFSSFRLFADIFIEFSSFLKRPGLEVIGRGLFRFSGLFINPGASAAAGRCPVLRLQICL